MLSSCHSGFCPFKSQVLLEALKDTNKFHLPYSLTQGEAMDEQERQACEKNKVHTPDLAFSDVCQMIPFF